MRCHLSRHVQRSDCEGLRRAGMEGAGKWLQIVNFGSTSSKDIKIASVSAKTPLSSVQSHLAYSISSSTVDYTLEPQRVCRFATVAIEMAQCNSSRQHDFGSAEARSQTRKKTAYVKDDEGKPPSSMQAQCSQRHLGRLCEDAMAGQTATYPRRLRRKKWKKRRGPASRGAIYQRLYVQEISMFKVASRHQDVLRWSRLCPLWWEGIRPRQTPRLTAGAAVSQSSFNSHSSGTRCKRGHCEYRSWFLEGWHSAGWI